MNALLLLLGMMEGGGWVREVEPNASLRGRLTGWKEGRGLGWELDHACWSGTGGWLAKGSWWGVGGSTHSLSQQWSTRIPPPSTTQLLLLRQEHPPRGWKEAGGVEWDGPRPRN